MHLLNISFLIRIQILVTNSMNERDNYLICNQIKRELFIFENICENIC